MSVAAIGRVMALGKDLRGTPRLVLIALSWHLNAETGRCDPSLPTLAGDAGVTERRAIAAVTELERRGLIRCHRQAGKRTRYEIVTPDAPVTPSITETPDAGDTPDAPVTPDDTSTDPCRQRHPTPVASVTPPLTLATPEREENGKRTGRGTGSARASVPVRDLWDDPPEPEQPPDPVLSQAPATLPVRLRDAWAEIARDRGPEIANRALAAARRLHGLPSEQQLAATLSCAVETDSLALPADRWPDWRRVRDERQAKLDAKRNGHREEPARHRTPVYTLDENGNEVPTGRYL